MGVILRRMDTVILDMAVTKMRLKPMMRVFTSRLVTARAEQIPRICRKMGFSFHSPKRKIRLLLDFATPNDLFLSTEEPLGKASIARFVPGDGPHY